MLGNNHHRVRLVRLMRIVGHPTLLCKDSESFLFYKFYSCFFFKNCIVLLCYY